jgi:hypothetical protein
MSTTPIPNIIPDEDAHRLAFTEVSFLLDIFAATIEELMGGATASVGRIAGRELARKLPIDMPAANKNEIIEEVAAHFKNGYDIRPESIPESSDTMIQFGNCAIREVCRTRQMPLGGELCQLFHYYFDGVINELVKCPVKSDVTPADDVCRCHMKFK